MAKYIGNPDFKHDSKPRTGVLLTNLGTPDAPTRSALRRYLKEFLSDPRVIEVPKVVWWFVLNLFILNTRPSSSAESYAKVWTNDGSPLLAISLKQLKALQQELGDSVYLELAMRYGNPSIANALEKFRLANVTRLLVFPLYPQYSAATVASTFDAITNTLKQWRWLPELHMITHYHDHPDYINALADSIRSFREQYGKPDKLLFSFHGLPKHYFLAGDPYHCECHKTARLVTENLQLAEEDWQVTFQSRFGPREWLRPYTDEVLAELAESGTKKVAVICPGFAADCLETLEEINIRYRKVFLEHGGEQFHYIPALNDEPDHIAMLKNIIEENCGSWLDKTADDNTSQLFENLKQKYPDYY